jgi:hypothetical protein
MKCGRKHEAHADFFNRRFYCLWRHLQVKPELFEDIGASASAGYGAVAVFGNGDVCACNDECGGGAYVKSLQRVPACSARIHKSTLHFGVNSDGVFPHNLRKRHQLLHRFALHPKCC